MTKEKIYKFLEGLSLTFIIIFIIMLVIDYINYNSYTNSAPFYAYLLVRSLEFILPSIVLFIIAMIIKKRGEKNEK